MEIFLGGLCVLTVVAFVGHGLWVATAAILRAMSGEPAASGTTRRFCPKCNAVIPAGKSRCASCGWGAEIRPQPPLKTLEGLVGQIDRLHKLGSLDVLAFERLNDALQTELERVRTQELQDQVARQAAAVAQKTATEPAGIFEIDTDVATAATTPGARSQITSLPRDTAATARPQSVAAPPAPPVRTWSELLDGFMEERNLRWGELVGGLLIVCGSIALVISFWSQIAERPFLKFFVFNGFTAAMFGAGAYCDRRLRLPTTSRGIYSISTLLVPLNFLAIAAFSRDSSADSVLTIAGELASIGLSAWLTWFAGRTTTPQAAPLLAAGVVGPSVAALLVRRFMHPDSGLPVLYTLGFLPLGFYIVSVALSLRRARGTEEPSESEVHSHYRFLGVTTFAAVLPLGLLVTRTADVAGTLRWLAPLVSLAAAPGLATGLFLWKRVTSPARTGIRTAGSAVAIAGVLILLAGAVLAWPHPTVMLLVALVNFGVLSAIAFTQSMPAAHLLALPCLGLAYLIVIHVMRGELSWGAEQSEKMAGALLSAASGTALVPLALLFGGSAAWLARTRRDDSRFFGLVAALSALLSLALVTCFGLGRVGDPGGTTWVYAVYAVMLLAGAVVLDLRRVRWAVPTKVAGTLRVPSAEPVESHADHKDENGTRSLPAILPRRHSPPYIKNPAELAAWGGCGLLLVAFIQGSVFNLGHTFSWQHPWLLAFLGCASALACASAGIRVLGARRETLETGQQDAPLPASASRPRNTPRILCESATVSSGAGLACLVFLVPTELPGQIAAFAFWLSAIWCLLAWQLRSTELFTAFQVGLTGTVMFAVAAWIRTRPWAVTTRDIWLDPWSWQLQGVALSLLGLTWAACADS